MNRSAGRAIFLMAACYAITEPFSLVLSLIPEGRCRFAGSETSLYHYSMKKLVLCLALCALASLNSCGDKGKDSPSGLREAKGGKNFGGTFLMNETGDLRSLDPP